MSASLSTEKIDPTSWYDSRVSDYISLLKPRVMSLVVFSGFAGLYLAPGTIHPFIAFIAILCIALGSGASGAINMWYERRTDSLMKRTRTRPIPTGKISPENAIEFAVILAFASVFIMGIAVNYMAAFLLLLAIVYYVFVYTIWLKPRTPQNIVIGGAAGAFPPVIGWAAVTGNVTIEPIILFAIIFMWTPPHFWALSLYRCEDYKKAGIPMLPVVAGVEETKKQILFYTMLLVPLTFVPVGFDICGIIYAISAAILGIIFIYHAIKVYLDNKKNTASKTSINMFKYSVIYLFLLFTMMMVDHAAR